MRRIGRNFWTWTTVACLGAFVLAASGAPASGQAQTAPVRVDVREADRRVDVFVDGQPFTAYIYPTALTKPVLYPLRTAGGTAVTRGFPLETRPGERVDHPHQIGLWFTYGDVNGFDFWNSSDAVRPEARPRMGRIVHRRVNAATNRSDHGVLEVEMDWFQPDGALVLYEHARFVFRGGPGWRSVDRITTLSAPGKRVSFTDNKEGMFGLRVARALELPAKTPDVFADADGRPSATRTLDNSAVTGDYLTSEGLTGDAVWGTRARWCALGGRVGSEVVSIAILDHPSNPGFPTYWHARGYGLFAANPLGQKAMSGGKETLDLALEPGARVTFRYRILILSEALAADRVEAAYRAFAAEGPLPAGPAIDDAR